MRIIHFSRDYTTPSDDLESTIVFYVAERQIIVIFKS